MDQAYRDQPLPQCLQEQRIRFEEITERAGEVPAEEYQDDEDTLYEVKRVKDAIMRLPDGYRQVLTLYLIEGYDHAEIADILGIQETGSNHSTAGQGQS